MKPDPLPPDVTPATDGRAAPEQEYVDALVRADRPDKAEGFAFWEAIRSAFREGMLYSLQRYHPMTWPCLACGVNKEIPRDSVCLECQVVAERRRAERAEAERDGARGELSGAEDTLTDCHALLDAAGVPATVPGDPEGLGLRTRLRELLRQRDAARAVLREVAETISKVADKTLWASARVMQEACSQPKEHDENCKCDLCQAFVACQECTNELEKTVRSLRAALEGVSQ